MQAAALESSTRKPQTATKFLKNSAANAGGMLISALIAFLLPAYLVHRLSVVEYGAWVLILNLSAYVGYLDFGVQTAVSKYIAEYDAGGDHHGCGQCASAGLFIMSAASLLGVILSLGLAWFVPALFRNMPAALYRDVRISIAFVGISLSISLATSIFPAIFSGLQRYHVPSMVMIVSRSLYAVALCVAVLLHSSLAVMGATVAAVNLFAAALRIVTWKSMAGHIRVSWHLVDFGILKRMAEYCFILSVWSVAMLFITGLDLTIVGHYAFAQVAYYSIAASPTNFLLVVVGALLGPLLPAASALSVNRTPYEMGRILLRSTRYTTILLLLTALPMLVGGFPMLRLWVGANFAFNSVQLLRVLLLANVVRMACSPYSTMVVATAKQRVATMSAITEASVNLVASVLLAMRFGAMGVAAGTLIGAFAGVGMHFGVSMRYTRNLAISRAELFAKGILRPSVMAVPSVLLLSRWWLSGAPSLGWQLWLVWFGSTLAIAWTLSLDAGDRTILKDLVQHRMMKLS
jgi:O-antigen/teichoic acid export membrane protein